jgi:enamine deaminase RidA (YjgF/YER057c/UK114 family)
MAVPLSPEQIVAAGTVVLGDPIPPIGKSQAVVVAEPFAFTSGIVALTTPGFELVNPGRFGGDLDLEQAKSAAAGAMLCTLANLRDALGSLDRILRFVSVTGFVQSADVAPGLPAVLDSASEVLQTLFGAELLPARAAVGVAALPGNASVELQCTVQLR